MLTYNKKKKCIYEVKDIYRKNFVPSNSSFNSI